jgi:hypothetical protein
MRLYPTDPSACNRPSAAPRLPDFAGLQLAADKIQRKYGVSPGLAKIVAEMVGASIGVRT